MRLVYVALLFAGTTIQTSRLDGQARPTTRRMPVPPPATNVFEPGEFLLGPSVLTGNVNGGGLALGGELEYGLTKNPSLGSGTIGLGLRIHSYSSSVSSGAFSASVRVTPVAVAANYHFPIEDKRFDPYLGLALGYASASYSDTDGSNFSVNSGTYLMIDAGGRYFFNPRTAAQAGISLGSRGDVGLLRLAVMFKL